ncbi:MAG: MFS transporter [Actinobacteria bacterium]|nr:MFS transporter [Actinomycetota bacterium]
MLRRERRDRGSSPVRVLRNPALRWLLAGHALSSTGQTLGLAAVSVAVYRTTGSTAWVAAAASAQFLPPLLLSGLAGVMADRTDRMALLARTSSARAFVVLALAAAVAIPLPAPALLALVLAVAALGTPAYPAVVAGVRTLVPPAELVAATASVATVGPGPAPERPTATPRRWCRGRWTTGTGAWADGWRRRSTPSPGHRGWPRP